MTTLDATTTPDAPTTQAGTISESIPAQGPTPLRQSVITVRAPRWDFSEDLGDVFGKDLAGDCSRVAFSLTLPYLEPYLIKVMRSVAPSIGDPGLRADLEAFCGQEAQHHRAHASANRVIRRLVGPETAARLQTVEQRLADDYRRFITERTPRFNAAYAEGFEAMTCAMAMTAATAPPNAPGDEGSSPWHQLWAWHLAEELEHRTVAFDVYGQVSGSYLYRVVTGLWAQGHFLVAVDRLYRILMAHHGRRTGLPHLPPMLRQGWSRYLRTFSPRYHPGAITPPRRIAAHLARLPAAHG